MTVAVITDSAASLPRPLVADWGIRVVPLGLTVGGRSYDDGQLPLDELVTRLDEDVTTSGPSPGQVTEVVSAALEEADEALVLTVADTMSSTFDSAQLGARLVGPQVRVVDTATAAGAEGLVVLAAARRAADGASLDEVEAVARRAIERVRLVATVPNLDRLVHSGRVPGIAGWAGDKLGVNPLFEFRSGHAKPLRPAFSRQAALDRLVAAWRDDPSGTPGSALHVAALHAQAREDADWLLEAVAEGGGVPVTSFVGEFSPVMVVHVGAGLVGLAWWWEPPG